jgi:hypothetical protein
MPTKHERDEPAGPSSHCSVLFYYKLQVVSGNDDPHGKLLLQFEDEHVWHGTQTIAVHENLLQLLISILL